jgi:type II secretory pathway component PulJ
MIRAPIPIRPRSGFSLVEVIVANGLMVLLVMILAQTWSGLVRPTIDLGIRTSLFQEANLATDALARDLAGSLANPEGRLGAKTSYPFIARLQPGNAQLWLCFDGGDPPNGVADWGTPDTVIVYTLQDTCLVRTDQNAGTTVTVARYLTGFQVQDIGGGVQIQLTFTYRSRTQTYTLVARDP